MEYSLVGETLTITGDLDQALDLTFDIHTFELLEQDASLLTIDLTGVSSMVSQYLGSLAALAVEVSKQNKQLRVIATGKVAVVIKQAGFDRIVQLETP